MPDNARRHIHNATMNRPANIDADTGYALDIHAAQGVTSDAVHYYIDGPESEAYIQMQRGAGREATL